MFAPILSLFFMIVSSGFIMSFISVYCAKLGFLDTQVGLIHTSLYCGMLLGSLNAKRVISRLGYNTSLILACCFLSFLTFILGWFSPTSWLYLRFFSGVCIGIFYVASESWLLVKSPLNKRGYILGLYTLSLYLGQSVGQLFLPYALKQLPFALSLSSLLFLSATIPVIVGKSYAPIAHFDKNQNVFSFFKHSPLGVFACLISGMIISTVFSFLPIYFEAKNLSSGVLMSVMILLGACCQYPFGKISDLFDRRRVLFWLGVCGCLVSISLTHMSEKVLFEYGLYVFGGIIFSIFPISVALGCECVSDEDIVSMNGLLLFSYGLGAVLGPIISPLAVSIFADYALIMIGLYAATLAVLALSSMKKDERKNNLEIFSSSSLLDEVNLR